MLYHAEAPPQHMIEPFTFGFLTTMARIEGKMRRKKPVTVTIIGGSVTAAYCKEPGIGCWVTPVTEWLLQENPQVTPLCLCMLHTMTTVANTFFTAILVLTKSLELYDCSDWCWYCISMSSSRGWCTRGLYLQPQSIPDMCPMKIVVTDGIMRDL